MRHSLRAGSFRWRAGSGPTGSVRPLDDFTVVVVGPLAPPANGMTIMTRQVLDADLGCRVRHVDTSDHRHVRHVGRFDARNVLLALRHLAQFTRVALELRSSGIAYMPVAQNSLGYGRDALMMAIAHFSGMRLVVHLHGGYFGTFYARSGRLWRCAIRRSMSWTDAAIVLGEALRAEFKGLTTADRVYVVPNAVPDVSLRSTMDAPEFTLLHLSNLQSSKGTLDTIRAFVQVVAERPECRLVLAGPWYTADDERQAQKLIDEANIGWAVTYAGEVDERLKAALFAQASVFVMPTYFRYEGQPLVILEAFRAGVPAIASEAGAIPETVRDGVCGLIVPSGDLPALVRALHRLAGDRSTLLEWAPPRARGTRPNTLRLRSRQI